MSPDAVVFAILIDDIDSMKAALPQLASLSKTLYLQFTVLSDEGMQIAKTEKKRLYSAGCVSGLRKLSHVETALKLFKIRLNST